MICMNKSFVLLIFEFCKTNLMANQNNQNTPNPMWEEVRGLSWIFYED